MGSKQSAVDTRSTVVLELAAVSAACTAVVVTTFGPRRDVDYWWHVLLGQALLSGDVSTATSWAVWPGDPAWQSAQPLAEIALATADRWWPAAAPTTVRALTAAMAMATLALVTRPWSKAALGVSVGRWWAFTWGSAVILGFTQERPAQVGLIAMPLVGALASWWATGRPVSRQGWLLTGCAALVMGGLWSLSHQSWMLAWSVLVVAVVLAPRPVATRALALGAMALIPIWSWWWLGPPWQAITTAGAAASLAEWQQTQFLSVPGSPATAMVVGCAAAMAMAAQRAPGDRWRRGDASRYAALLVLGVAGATAWRHVPVSVLAAAPVLIAHVEAHTDRRWPNSAGPLIGTPGRRPGLRRTILMALPVVLTVAGMHVAAHLAPAQHSDADHVADLAQSHTCRLTGPAIIATHYNHSGPALAGARTANCAHAPQMQVVIDGRADRYGADALRRWQDVLNAEGRNWERDWCAVDPDMAILPTYTPLSGELRQRGWQLAELRSGIAVLVRPSAVDKSQCA